MSDKTELKTCPFCGKNNIRWSDDGFLYYYICNNCSAFGPTESTIEKATAAWNTRAEVPNE